MTARRLAGLVVALAAATPLGTAAQGCGLVPGAGVSASGGAARYAVADGLSGPSLGADATLALPVLSLRASYRRVLLADATPDPDIGRLAVAARLPLKVPWFTICGTGHAGVAALPLDGEATTVMAGGLGLLVARAFPVELGRLVPFLEVRGLAARTAGTVFGVEIDATGLSLGVEGGVRAVFGPLTLRLSGSADGFDDGLGLTPYPAAAGEVGVGLRF